MEAATAKLGRRRKRGKTYGSEERRLAALLLTPAMAVIALVAAYPIGYAIWLSFNEYSVRTCSRANVQEVTVYADPVSQ